MCASVSPACPSDCERLRQLPDGLGRLSALRVLEIGGCSQLLLRPLDCVRLAATSLTATAKLHIGAEYNQVVASLPARSFCLSIVKTNRTQFSLLACGVGHLDPI
jgi:hypothetical protein